MKKNIRIFTTSLLIILSIGISSCNNQVKSSDLEDRVENGKYIVYKKGDNSPFTGVSIPTEILI
jgi:hypothetical protein